MECITVWFSNCCAQDHKILQSYKGSHSIIQTNLHPKTPSISLFLEKVANTIKEHSEHCHSLFPLPSDRRNKSLKVCTTRFKNSFFLPASDGERTSHLLRMYSPSHNLPHCRPCTLLLSALSLAVTPYSALSLFSLLHYLIYSCMNDWPG